MKQLVGIAIPVTTFLMLWTVGMDLIGTDSAAGARQPASTVQRSPGCRCPRTSF